MTSRGACKQVSAAVSGTTCQPRAAASAAAWRTASSNVPHACFGCELGKRPQRGGPVTGPGGDLAFGLGKRSEAQDRVTPLPSVSLRPRHARICKHTQRRKFRARFVEVERRQATYSVCSLPPCGGGLGRGVVLWAMLVRVSHDPHPQPLPTRGRGVHRG